MEGGVSRYSESYHTFGGGASRYDGKAFTTFTTDDGLASNHIYSIFQDREGDLWFGTGGFPDPGKGVSRYDGKVWKTYATQDGLPDLTVSAITQDREGHLWFGTANGVSRYDGQTMTQYTTADGLAHNRIRTIYPDREGHLWFGTEHGVSRYDGKGFETFTTKDGLADNQVRSIYQDREGHLWIGTLGGGVSRYDGRIFQKITRQDGLAGNGVYSVLQDRKGHLWFGILGGGVTRYTPSLPVHPPTFIDAVVAGRRYEGVPELSVPSSVGLVAFEFHGISFKTRPDAMVYRYRLKGHDKDWRITHRRRVEYLDVPTGTYTFEVQAVDRDLVYSKRPATVSLEVYYQPMSSSVQISELVVQDVFASFYKTYAKASIGSMRVSNDDPNPVEAKVSFYIPDFMGRPTEQTVVLKPHSVQQIPLRAILKPEVLDLIGDMSVQAEVALSCKVSEHTISVKEFRNMVIHGRGVLSWDSLGRAAAFVTPEDPNVSTFARGLYDAYRHQVKGSPSAGNIPTAMLMFEALNTHGIKYAPDSSTPYSQVRADRSVLDNIQYPAELLHSKLGDCDDCTALYCSLLENLNIPTAFVDAPAHILMMFDSGVATERAFGFRMDEDRYILRGDRFWIPVEVTKLGEGSFMEAWELGMKICRRLEAEGGLRITDVREGWTQYPYVLPTVDGEVQLPDAEGLERFFLSNVAEFHRLREDYVKRRYIFRLIENPDDHVRRIELAQTKIESEDYNDAITAVLPLLHSGYQDYANYLIGCAYAGLDDFEMAAQYFERALEQDPGNPNYERGLEVLKALIQKQKGGIAR